MEAIVKNLKDLAALANKSAPYLLLEILLPGGTLFALLLFLHRRSMGERGSIVDQAIGRLRGALLLAQPSDMAAVTARAANDEDGLAPLAMAPAR